MKMTKFTVLPILLLAGGLMTPDLPNGYWSLDQSEEILSKTLTLRLAPDLSRLSSGEAAGLKELLQVGEIFQRLYEDALHHQAWEAKRKLEALDRQRGGPPATRNLLQLYRLFRGPVATTLENQRQPFLPVDEPVPGANVYPWKIEKAEVEAYLTSHPEQRDQILGERTVVRRAEADQVRQDLASLERHPALATLHPKILAELKELEGAPDASRLYAVPYAVAYADQLMEAYDHLLAAADHVQASDDEFAGYLRNRARDLLTNDYESGDAAWVTGHFRHLNAQIGAYETYDDSLFGVKAFWAVSLLSRNVEKTQELEKGLAGLQAIEDALPYDHHKRVREDIPVGVYEVIADFGQARGTNTATILPNDPLFSRRYGRTILLRENIMTHPELFAISERLWKAAVGPSFSHDLVPEGDFYRTLWHEVGHYLGVDRDRQGRTLDTALQDYADALEEMKADLVSLFAMHKMAASGAVGAARLRAVQAGGIRRTLQNNQPRKDQPYQTMQLSQFNYFLRHGLLEFDPQEKVLVIHYDRYETVVTALLKEVLDLQYQGDAGAAERFFTTWTVWSPELHGALASKIREAQGPRFRLVRYAALGE